MIELTRTYNNAIVFTDTLEETAKKQVKSKMILLVFYHIIDFLSNNKIELQK